MTESADAIATSLFASLREVGDPVERYQKVKELETRIDRGFKEIKAEVANELHDSRSWSEVGKLLGVTGSRAEQISRAAR
ncbi:hypothetical protein LUW77_03335 [Streptomyces radiopugnans]|nr:hypothetical protein LUW77_03335 [Streptomyces radiopugnans]